MKMLLAALVAVFSLTVSANASYDPKEGYGPIRAEHHAHVRHHVRHRHINESKIARRVAQPTTESSIQPHPAGCPRTAFCGCGVAKYIFGEVRRGLWLASNWFAFPRAQAAPGMVAVRNHHVMAIISVHGDGTATVYDPNSGGHMTRIHRRSLAGFSIRNPHGHGYASAG